MYFYSIKSPKVTARATDMQGDPPRCQQPSSPCLVAHRFCSSAASKPTRALTKRLGRGFAAHPAPTRGGSRLQHTLRHLSPPRLTSPSWAHRSQAAALHPRAHPSLPAFPESTKHTTHSCRESQGPPEASQARDIYRQIASKSDHNLFFSSPRAFATSSP